MLEQMPDLQHLIQNEIPEGRSSLENSHTNLEKVAAFCEANYIQASSVADKRAALTVTRQYTIQSLASVAYQINGLANNMLAMLDMQADKLGDMATRVHEIDQIINIHKEKVARREIGQLTTNKIIRPQHKIVQPSEPEPQRRYVRQAIDYSLLDDIGVCVRDRRLCERMRRTGHGVRVQSAPMQSRYHTISLAHGAALARTESGGSGGSIGTNARAAGSLGPAHGQRIATIYSSYDQSGQYGAQNNTEYQQRLNVNVDHSTPQHDTSDMPPPPSPGMLDYGMQMRECRQRNVRAFIVRVHLHRLTTITATAAHGRSRFATGRTAHARLTHLRHNAAGGWRQTAGSSSARLDTNTLHGESGRNLRLRS
ncbi:unnamed protein product [Sphagnum balticum]